LGGIELFRRCRLLKQEMISFKILVKHKNSDRAVVLSPPVNLYYADPFLLRTSEDTALIAFEVYDRIRRKGRIDQLIVNFKDLTVKQKNLISEDFHISYPCPIFHGDKIYISPESSQINRQLIYELAFTENFATASLVSEIKCRMVDATFIPSGVHGIYDIYFYTGSSNDDGLLISADLRIADGIFVLGNSYSVVGNSRPAGMLMGAIQPFQKNNGSYGRGVEFYSKLNKNLNAPCGIPEFPTIALSVRDFLDSSHHINERNGYLCMDIMSNVECRFSSKVKFI
jgi:hypothetical protein